MAEPTLVQVFGTGATQDSSTLTIQKSALAVPAVGLTPSANNTAESLLVALLKLWQLYLTTTNQESNSDQQITIEDGFPQTIFRNNINYKQKSKTINLQKIDTDTEINPDEF